MSSNQKIRLTRETELLVPNVNGLDDFYQAVKKANPAEHEEFYQAICQALGPLAAMVDNIEKRDALSKFLSDNSAVANLEMQFTVKKFMDDYEEIKRPWHKFLHRGFLNELKAEQDLATKYSSIINYALDHPESDAHLVLERMNKTRPPERDLRPQR